MYCSCAIIADSLYFQVKIAEFSETPEDFLKKYDELKSKNVRTLDSLVYLLSKLSEDKEVMIVSVPFLLDATGRLLIFH